MPLPPFAEFLHASRGLSSSHVVARRRSEEIVAAALLGSTVGFLPFRDAIYRESRYTSEATLFGEPTIDEDDLSDRIAEALGANAPPDPATQIYCPLAIGGHVDHRHAFSAGSSTLWLGRPLLRGRAIRIAARRNRSPFVRHHGVRHAASGPLRLAP
jgi:hypothetical protein